MKFMIEISCDNAAFGDGERECGEELSRILAKLSTDLNSRDVGTWTTMALLDINGNVVGRAYGTDAS